MAARAIWRGIIRLGNVTVPVKFYSAIEDRKVHFRLLHVKDQTPVKQEMVHPQTGKPVASEDIVRAYATAEGELVVLRDDELEAFNPEPSREIQITRFVHPELINHQWYDRPYYVGPDGDAEPYFALARALEKERKEGVARWTMRNKEYIGALSATNGYLKIITLRHTDEVVSASDLPRPQSRPLEKQELKMAEQLVSALEADFDPAAFHDEYREQVLQLVATKARGGTLHFAGKRERKPKRAPLAEMLEQSIKQLKRERQIA